MYVYIYIYMYIYIYICIYIYYSEEAVGQGATMLCCLGTGRSEAAPSEGGGPPTPVAPGFARSFASICTNTTALSFLHVHLTLVSRRYDCLIHEVTVVYVHLTALYMHRLSLASALDVSCVQCRARLRAQLCFYLQENHGIDCLVCAVTV